MVANSSISWTDDTFSPWIGCTKVSPACDGCYAEHLMDTRMHRVQWGPHGERQRTSEANWKLPLKWEREQAAKVLAWREGSSFPQVLPIARAPVGPRPERFIFCASLADVFDNAVPTPWRRDLFDLIRKTPHLTWLLLTKRPGNIIRLFRETTDLVPPYAYNDDDAALAASWPRNAAIGCTVVTQAEADRDIPVLLRAKAALRPAFAFVSMEPPLGPVDLTNLDCGAKRSGAHGWSALWPLGERPRLDWVITGGETDQGKHKARPSHPDWFRSLRDQCASAGVAYHHKQNGEWGQDPDLDRPFVAHHSHAEPGTIERLQSSKGEYAVAWTHRSEPKGSITEGIQLKRMGKKAAGRLLDGVIHDVRPEIAR